MHLIQCNLIGGPKDGGCVPLRVDQYDCLVEHRMRMDLPYFYVYQSYVLPTPETKELNLIMVQIEPVRAKP